MDARLARTLPGSAAMTRSPLLRKLLLGVAVSVTTASAARVSTAETPAPVEVVLKEAPPTHETFAIEWNPLALIIDRVSLDVVIAPGDHHALVLSPFYTFASTDAYATNIDSNGNPLVKNGAPYTLNVLPQNFHGFGGEIGYRYYFDQGGPRGFFIGPSFIIAAMNASAGNCVQLNVCNSTTQTSYFDLGGALDVGYQAIIADAITFTVGAGAQYAGPSKSIPDQQWPATIYANAKLQPRLLLSIGYAF
jgi:hypothetical protein